MLEALYLVSILCTSMHKSESGKYVKVENLPVGSYVSKAARVYICKETSIYFNGSYLQRGHSLTLENAYLSYGF